MFILKKWNPDNKLQSFICYNCTFWMYARSNTNDTMWCHGTNSKPGSLFKQICQLMLFMHLSSQNLHYTNNDQGMKKKHTIVVSQWTSPYYVAFIFVSTTIFVCNKTLTYLRQLLTAKPNEKFLYLSSFFNQFLKKQSLRDNSCHVLVYPTNSLQAW